MVKCNSKGIAMVQKMVKKIKNMLKCEPKKEYKFTPEQIEKFKKACCWDETSDYRK